MSYQHLCKRHKTTNKLILPPIRIKCWRNRTCEARLHNCMSDTFIGSEEVHHLDFMSKPSTRFQLNFPNQLSRFWANNITDTRIGSRPLTWSPPLCLSLSSSIFPCYKIQNIVLLQILQLTFQERFWCLTSSNSMSYFHLYCQSYSTVVGNQWLSTTFNFSLFSGFASTHVYRASGK